MDIIYKRNNICIDYESLIRGILEALDPLPSLSLLFSVIEALITGTGSK